MLGDVVLLAEGDRVPADIRLVEASNFAVDESLLTGESAPVAKEAGDPARAGAGSPTLAEGTEPSHAYSGTLVTRGTARGDHRWVFWGRGRL